MTKGKAGDSSRIVIEMILKGGPLLMNCIAALFTDVLDVNAIDLDSWRKTTESIVQKRDAQDPSNYRPIAIFPVLYKVFARVLCDRISGILDASHLVE